MTKAYQKPWSLQFGARPLKDGTEFRVWAPKPQSLALEINGSRFELSRATSEIFSGFVPGVGPGTRYSFLLDGRRRRPDPVSRSQPDGVHASSEVVNPDGFEWTDQAWCGLELEQYIITELHIGTFTREGTFDGAITKLSALREAGITAVEIMPLAEFEGNRNWGYDGVDLYAPKSAYGGPLGLKRLVDACHRLGLAACLDVVYNHLGPSGNYLSEFAPYLTNRYRTPWGEAINYDGAGSDMVRRFIIDNALYWITEYHFDALRLDAVHGIFDFSAAHILEELAASVRCQAEALGRKCVLIAESDLNDPRITRPVEAGGYGLDAQWNDDFHHSLHALMSGTKSAYFVDFGTVADLAKALSEGFVLDGRRSEFRHRRHGRSSAGLPGKRFVIFTQNHDQIANACGGARHTALLEPEQNALAMFIMFVAPNVPMLFMGQEFGATAPFYFFTSFKDAGLARAVSEGRAREVAGFASGLPFIDPQSEDAFVKSRIDWTERGREYNQRVLSFVKRLIEIRVHHDCLSNMRKDLMLIDFSDEDRWLVIERGDVAGNRAVAFSNLSADARMLPIPDGLRDAALELTTLARADRSALPSSLGDAKTLRLEGWAGALYLSGANN